MGTVELAQDRRQIKSPILRKCFEERTGYFFIGWVREENRPWITLPSARRNSDHRRVSFDLLVHESDSSIVIKHGLEAAGTIVQRLPRAIPCEQMMIRQSFVIDIPRVRNVKVRPERGDPRDLARQRGRRYASA